MTTASEALYEFQRSEIEGTWDIRVQDSYGLKEHNVFIAQCRSGSYHISPEYGVCEIADDGGKPVQPGEEGWIVATGLHNYAQPLLRYNTQDRAIAGTASCPCGRTLPTVERLVGRIDDCLYAADGRRFSGLSFAFFQRRGVIKARLTQETLESVTLEIVATPEFDESERRALLEALGQKVNRTLRFDIRLVDEIRQKTPGKFKFVVSKIHPPGRQPAAG